MRVKCLLGQTHAEKPYGVHYRVFLWCTWARCVRIVHAQGRILAAEHYSTGVKMFKNINYYNARDVSTVQTQSRTVRYYCCEYLQEVYTDRTACMPQNLQASQYSWCKHQDVMQTRCCHDVRARRHLRLDMCEDVQNINYYNARGVSTVQTQSRTEKYYCCEYLQEIYTDRTAYMPQNLQASQYSWCKHQDVMQTRCCHDVRATGRHLRLDMMTHRDAFPISHNVYRLRYIMVSIRAHPSTQKKTA